MSTIINNKTSKNSSSCDRVRRHRLKKKNEALDLIADAELFLQQKAARECTERACRKMQKNKSKAEADYMNYVKNEAAGRDIIRDSELIHIDWWLCGSVPQCVYLCGEALSKWHSTPKGRKYIDVCKKEAEMRKLSGEIIASCAPSDANREKAKRIARLSDDTRYDISTMITNYKYANNSLSIVEAAQNKRLRFKDIVDLTIMDAICLYYAR